MTMTMDQSLGGDEVQQNISHRFIRQSGYTLLPRRNVVVAINRRPLVVYSTRHQLLGGCILRPQLAESGLPRQLAELQSRYHLDVKREVYTSVLMSYLLDQAS